MRAKHSLEVAAAAKAIAEGGVKLDFLEKDPIGVEP